MKKVLCILSCLTLLFLSACGNASDKVDETLETEATTLADAQVNDPFGTTAEATTTPTTTPTTSAQQKKVLDFSVTTLDNKPFTFDDCEGAKVIMLNFWEPWCNPCVSEMPDLEKLYKAYQSEGLLILGVFCTEEADEDAKAVIEDSGITYPILHGTDDALLAMTTEYVPTTVFLDANGNVLTAEPFIGAKPYSEWESIVKGYLS